MLFKRLLKTAGLSALWALVLVAISIGAEFVRQPVPEGLESIQAHLFENLEQASSKTRFGSAAIILVQNGKVVSVKGFGLCNTDPVTRLNTGQSLFRVASVSKAVTAWGIMKLVQDGKIGLDEPIIKYMHRWRFPGSGEYGKKVTIRHLLSHTAGFSDGFGFSGVGLQEPLQTPEESLTLPNDVNMGAPHPAVVEWEPGTAISYSSVGYTVLQLLIEEITNKPFDDYMKEAVLLPLGMTKSNFDIDEIIIQGREPDLVANYDKNLTPHPHHRYTAMAAGSLRTTPDDLAKFMSAYFSTNDVLNAETLREMATPQPGTQLTWGLGHQIYLDLGDQGYLAGHDGGGFPRTGASFRFNQSTGNGIAVLMTGGTEMINPYIDDWTYWETRRRQFDIRNVFHSRIKIALLLLVTGAAVIAWMVIRKG